MTKNFALIGAAGYIAPRHLKAVHDTGNRLVGAVDPSDSVGVIDQYFPEARFFTEIERFDRFLEKLRRQSSEQQVDYVAVCSPNYLHDAHCRLGLRVHADVICEKPLVVSPWNLDALGNLEQEYGKRIYTVLQLRLLPSLIALRDKIAAEPTDKMHDIELSYITRRGPWYFTSWKGDRTKSGGVAMNIGIHFFDLLIWLFGPCIDTELHLNRDDRMAGFLELNRARVSWFLSVNKSDLPDGYLEDGKAAYRSLTMDGDELEFSSGFTDLHTQVYRDILDGGGYGIDEARPAVELVHRIRTSKEHKSPEVVHPTAARILGQASR